jgi:hypothetical protein
MLCQKTLEQRQPTVVESEDRGYDCTFSLVSPYRSRQPQSAYIYKQNILGHCNSFPSTAEINDSYTCKK